MRKLLILVILAFVSPVLGQVNPSQPVAPLTNPVFNGKVTAPSLAITGTGSTGIISDMSAFSFGSGIPRAMKDFLSNEVYAADYGVVPNDGVDDGPALRQAAAVAQQRRARLRMPGGAINVCTDPNDADALLRITSVMELSGASRGTTIVPCAEAGNRHIILVKPLASAGGIRGLYLHDFSIGTLGQTRSGGDGIRLDTTNLNGFIAKPTIERVGIAAGSAGKRAIRHVNNPDPATGNRNGGVFGGTFQDNDLFGGIQFDETGDSNNVLRNVITGPGIGIEYRAISGAATHIFDANNITSAGGAIYARGAQVKITRNQMEQSAPYTGTDGAMVVLDAAQDWTIFDNNMNAYDRVDCVLAKGSSTFGNMESNSTIYADNHFLYRAVGSQQNTLGRQRRDTRLANATYDANGNYVSGTFTTRNRPLTSLDTASEPTFGIYQKLALQNGWGDGAAAAFYQGLFVTRTPDGTLRFRGVTTAGTLTAGTTIAQLPGALYPEKAIVVAGKLSGAPWSLAIFQILPSGQIQALSVPTAGSVYWDDVSASRN